MVYKIEDALRDKIYNEYVSIFNHFLTCDASSSLSDITSIDMVNRCLEGAYLFIISVGTDEEKEKITELWVKWNWRYLKLTED